MDHDAAPVSCAICPPSGHHDSDACFDRYAKLCRSTPRTNNPSITPRIFITKFPPTPPTSPQEGTTMADTSDSDKENNDPNETEEESGESYTTAEEATEDGHQRIVFFRFIAFCEEPARRAALAAAIRQDVL